MPDARRTTVLQANRHGIHVAIPYSKCEDGVATVACSTHHATLRMDVDGAARLRHILQRALAEAKIADLARAFCHDAQEAP